MASSISRPVITVIGSMNMDLVTYTSRIPAGGETMTANSFKVGLGGKGANQAVACAKLSRPRAALDQGTAVVRMVGAVGSDAYGGEMRAGLRGWGVDVSSVMTRGGGAKTGVAVILVEEVTGENRILLSPEANYSLAPGDFAELPAPLPDLIIMQLEIPLATVLQILETASARGVPVLLNPAPAQKIPERYYGAITHLVVNETEAAFLADCEVSYLDTLDGLAAVADKFQRLGSRNVLITLGGRGVYYLAADGKHGLIDAEKANVVDTTAAGDTFIGTYALGVVGKDFDMETTVRAANRAAAKTVERKGAQESIPWLDEL